MAAFHPIDDIPLSCHPLPDILSLAGIWEVGGGKCIVGGRIVARRSLAFRHRVGWPLRRALRQFRTVAKLLRRLVDMRSAVCHMGVGGIQWLACSHVLESR